MRLITATLLLSLSSAAFARNNTLPRGIGLIQVGNRSYGDATDSYDASGSRGPIAGKYSRELKGEDLKAGDGGGDLQKLATEIDRMDPNGGTDKALLRDLDLGRIETSVKGKVSATFLGVAYGLTNKWTLFGGVPYVHAAVDASLVYRGDNNAAAIKQRLGGYAYGELQSGLDEAAGLSLARVQAAFGDYGYEPLGHWEKSGVGDMVVGARTGFSQRLAGGLMADLSLVPGLSLPTGYVEDPDLLQDVSFGTGYYAATMEATPQVSWKRYLHAATPVTYAHNFDTKVRKRVPEADEGLVAAERTRSVSLDPGDDTDVALALGGGTGLVDATVQQGVRRHYGDRYSGGLSGNYAALGENTDKQQTYRMATIKVDTSTLYMKGRFAVPFIAALTAFETVAGKNCNDERYYQLSLSTFFSAGGSR